jgi:hypothetical protein
MCSITASRLSDATGSALTWPLRLTTPMAIILPAAPQPRLPPSSATNGGPLAFQLTVEELALLPGAGAAGMQETVEVILYRMQRHPPRALMVDWGTQRKPFRQPVTGAVRQTGELQQSVLDINDVHRPCICKGHRPQAGVGMFTFRTMSHDQIPSGMLLFAQALPFNKELPESLPRTLAKCVFGKYSLGPRDQPQPL